jgi:L-arabinonolactonase
MVSGRDEAPVVSKEPEPAELVVDCRCVLGESILWCPRREVLWWTDIQSSRLWMHRPESRRTRSWNLPDRLGCLALCESGKLLLGLAKGLFLADADWISDEPPELSSLAPVEADEPRTRINDGRCDRAGNLVFGTFNEHPTHHPIGSFYQYSQRGLRRLDLGGVAIPNSICFSPDGDTLYYCDSTQPRILCCDYDAGTAQVAQCREFAALPERGSCADGSTIDSEGFLWNAQWGAAQVVRYTPRGQIDRVVPVPAKNPSCVAFGGRQLDQIYISTARIGLSAEDLGRLEQSGGVYRWHSPVNGLPENRVRHL